MLQAGLKFEVKEGKTFDPLPEDVYQVELFDIEMQEKPSYNDKTKMENVLSFQFVVLDGELRGRSIWRNFVPTFLYISQKHGKNALYQITEAIIKREMRDEEIAYFGSDFINKLVGYQCRITVKNKEGKEGKVFSNIDTFLPAKATLPKLTDEEREKAKVKVKEKTLAEKVQEEMSEKFATEHQGDNMEEIPIIHLDDDKDEIKIEDVPF